MTNQESGATQSSTEAESSVSTNTSAEHSAEQTKAVKDPELRARIEAALFVTDEPLSAADLTELLEIDGHEIREVMEELKDEYDREQRGVQLIRVSGGFKMTTRERHYEFLKTMFGERTLPRLSDSAIEALVIVAYHQPIIRQELESIRGVNSQSVLNTLLDQNFIRIAGRRDEIGRPIEYRTTSKFLDYFGLNTLNDLPAEEDINELLEEVPDSSP